MGKNINEAPRRKRTGYRSRLKSKLDYGGHVVSPKPPTAYFTPPQADGVLKKHNKFFKFGFLILFNSIFLINTISLGLADTANLPGEPNLQKERLMVRKGKISVDCENVPLGKILNQLKDQNNIWIKSNESLLDKTISVRFKNLSLEEGVNRILGFINHALVYHANGRLAGVILFEKSNMRDRATTKKILSIPELSSATILQEDIKEDPFDGVPPSSEQSQEEPGVPETVSKIQLIKESGVMPIAPGKNKGVFSPADFSAGKTIGTLGVSNCMMNSMQVQ